MLIVGHWNQVTRANLSGCHHNGSWFINPNPLKFSSKLGWMNSIFLQTNMCSKYKWFSHRSISNHQSYEHYNIQSEKKKEYYLSVWFHYRIVITRLLFRNLAPPTFPWISGGRRMTRLWSPASTSNSDPPLYCIC